MSTIDIGDRPFPTIIHAKRSNELRRYVPERTARLEYDDVHGCNICTGCGERYEHGMYMSVTYDDFIAYKPMRYCPACGARLEGSCTMITDEERREVARKLRAGAEYLPNDMYSDDLELELAKTVCEYDTPSVDVLFNRLADLIEPSMPSDPGEAGLASVDGFIREMRHSTKEEQDEYGAMLEKMSVEMHPVDRDALLALADECMDASRAYAGDGHGLTSKQFANVARRIREALGVQGQQERGRI